MDMESIPIDEQIDSPEKFARIVRMHQGKGTVFTDNQFPDSVESLGPNSSQ